MRTYLYRVEFRVGIPKVGPFAEVWAMSAPEAVILAQAERIKQGFDWTVESCIRVEDGKP